MFLNLIIILFLGLLTSSIFKAVKLPSLLGLIILGVIISPYHFDFIHRDVLSNAPQLRTLALIVLLLKAGLGINIHTIKALGPQAIKMSILPCVLEGIIAAFISFHILGISLLEAAMLGFILAGVSPAIVIPSMLELKNASVGSKKDVPTMILAGASIDSVLAIALFTAIASIEVGSTQTFNSLILFIPFRMTGGIFLGIFSGYIFNLIPLYKNTVIKDFFSLILLLSFSFFVLQIGDYLRLTGLLGLLSMGIIISYKSETLAKKLQGSLNKIWIFAQIFLFVLIGASVDIKVAVNAGLLGLVIILCGLAARSIGVLISLKGSSLNKKERLFSIIAYTPKATVQAAIGGIPLTMGFASGDLILAIAVLAIMITAPIGAIAIKVSSKRLL